MIESMIVKFNTYKKFVMGAFDSISENLVTKCSVYTIQLASSVKCVAMATTGLQAGNQMTPPPVRSVGVI